MSTLACTTRALAIFSWLPIRNAAALSKERCLARSSGVLMAGERSDGLCDGRTPPGVRDGVRFTVDGVGAIAAFQSLPFAKFSFRHRGHRTGVHTDANSTPLEGPWTPFNSRTPRPKEPTRPKSHQGAFGVSIFKRWIRSLSRSTLPRSPY